MNKLETKTLKELVSFLSRGVTPNYSEEGIPVINQRCIRDNKVIYTECRFTHPSTKISSNKYLRSGDVLVNSTGTGTLGRSAVYRSDIPHITVDGHVTILRPNENVVPLYLGYYLHYIESYLDVLGRGATNQKELVSSDLKRIKIPLPDLSTQKKIADILSAYDDLIENNLARISLLEKMASELYKEWFVRFRFPGHETAKFVDGVPEGWDVVQVESVSSLLRRGISPVYNDDGEYTVINQKCIRSSILSLDEARKQERKYPKELNLQDADTIICSTGTGTLGRVGKVFGDLPNTTYDSHVTVVRAAENIGKHYLYHTLKINQTYLMSQGRGSTNQQELSRDTIKKLKIFLPTTEIMQRFEEFIEPIHKEILLTEIKLENLTKQRDLLLPRLMSGKLSVEPLLADTA